MRLSTRNRSVNLHKPRVEALEMRAVLSVCGVECALSDGVLEVAGTDGADSIALRYDASAGLVSVIGGESELIGQFRLSEVQRLSIQGGAGDDRFEIDSLPLPLSVDGGEGEDLLASSALFGHAHSHGSVTGTLLDHSSVELSELLPLTSQLPEALSNSPLASAGSLPFGSLAFSLTGNWGAMPTSLVADVHQQHAAVFGGIASGLSTAAGGAAEPASHTHFAPLAAASDTAGRSVISGDWTPAETADRLAAAAHHVVSSSGPTSEVVAKFAPKRCTVRLTSKEASRTVAGEKKCDCAQKQAAAEATAARAAAAQSSAAAPAKTTTAAPACPRCQLVLEQAAGNEILKECVLPLNDSEPVGSQPADIEHELVWSEPTGGSWLPSSQLAGWGLLGAGLLLAPVLRRKSRRGQSEADRFAAAADFCFGRLAVERLAR